MRLVCFWPFNIYNSLYSFQFQRPPTTFGLDNSKRLADEFTNIKDSDDVKEMYVYSKSHADNPTFYNISLFVVSCVFFSLLSSALNFFFSLVSFPFVYNKFSSNRILISRKDILKGKVRIFTSL